MRTLLLGLGRVVFGWVEPGMVGVVPSMVGLVPGMVGVVPSMVGVVPSMVGRVRGVDGVSAHLGGRGLSIDEIKPYAEDGTSES